MAGFRCALCNNDMLAAMDSEEAMIEGHRLVGHLKCRACGLLYTPRRRQEHELVHHPHACEDCDSRFTTDSNLARHRSRAHRKYACPLCPIDQQQDARYDGADTLRRHVESTHHAREIYKCTQCNKVSVSEANHRRHLAIFHHKECPYCQDQEEDVVNGVDGCHRYATTAQLREHIATTHNPTCPHFKIQHYDVMQKIQKWSL